MLDIPEMEILVLILMGVQVVVDQVLLQLPLVRVERMEIMVELDNRADPVAVAVEEDLVVQVPLVLVVLMEELELNYHQHSKIHHLNQEEQVVAD